MIKLLQVTTTQADVLKGKSQAFVFLIVLLIVFAGCEKNNADSNFSADFTYSFNDNNHVLFTNASQGEYYSLIWNFGNGQADTTTDKKKDYVIYYPEAGDYQVSLRLTDYSGNKESTAKTVTVTQSDLVLSFTTEVDANNPNNVFLTNTTQGTYDSFKWIYRNEEVVNEPEYTAYFPFAGNYNIEMVVIKNNITHSIDKMVAISQDDPDYIENLELVWSDEFDGTAVNTNFWSFETGASGWGNNELQYYTDGDNADIVDGKLIITARKVDENMEPGSYTSTRLASREKKEFQYGRMEIRAKLPSGTGVWPAIWMLGSNFTSVGWPACGEIDIMEYVGYSPNIVHSTVHTPAGYAGNGNGNSMTVPTCEEAFHNYGLIWNENELVFYVDSFDNVVHTYAPAVKTTENWPFDQPAFFILNLAVGGDWGGAQGIDNSIFPQTLEIDYVRVYQESK